MRDYEYSKNRLNSDLDPENQEDLVSIPKEQVDLLIAKANIELLQRVNKLLDRLEKQEDQILEIIEQQIQWVEKQEVFNPRDQEWNRARIQHGKRILDKIKEHFGR